MIWEDFEHIASREKLKQDWRRKTRFWEFFGSFLSVSYSFLDFWAYGAVRYPTSSSKVKLRTYVVSHALSDEHSHHSSQIDFHGFLSQKFLFQYQNEHPQIRYYEIRILREKKHGEDHFHLFMTWTELIRLKCLVTSMKWAVDHSNREINLQAVEDSGWTSLRVLY